MIHWHYTLIVCAFVGAGAFVHGVFRSSDRARMAILKEKHRHEYEMYLLRKELGEKE